MPLNETLTIHLISDLHLERYDIGEYRLPKSKKEKQTVLVIAGDLCSNGTQNVAVKFLKQMANRYKAVVYVFGNHEYYGGVLKHTTSAMRSTLIDLKNVYILDNQTVNIDGVNFIGSTLWSEVDPQNTAIISQRLSDYHHILNEQFYPLTVSKTIGLFRQNKKFIEESLTKYKGQPNVVVTHHLPSFNLVSPNFTHSPLTSAFASNLESVIESGRPDAWLFGHSHDPADIDIFGARVCSNPMGYKHISVPNYHPLTITINKKDSE